MFKDICGSCGMKWTSFPNNGFCCSAPMYQPDEKYVEEEEDIEELDS